MTNASMPHVEFAEEIIESLSDREDLESIERHDTPGVQKVDLEYEGDTYRIRTYPRDLDSGNQEYPARATVKRVEGDEEVRVGEAYGMDERELADEVYGELTGEGSSSLQEVGDIEGETKNTRPTPNYHDRWELEDGREVGKIGGPQYLLNENGQIVSPPLHGIEAIDDGIYAVVYRNHKGGDETGLIREENLDESIHERMEEFRERDTEILDRPGDNRASPARIANRKAKVRAKEDVIDTTPGAITAAKARAKALDLFGDLFE